MEENKSIVKVNPDVEALALQNTQSMAEIFIKSGFFPDVKTASQGIVKILAGKEIGLSPIQAMQHVFVIPSQNGPKIQLSGNVMAAKIRQSGVYDYRIIESTEKACEIEFFRLPGMESIGKYRFTMEDANKAGLCGKQNWKGYPRDMLFNRAISGGYKQHCPDIFNIIIYTDADDIQDYSEQENQTQEQPVIQNKNFVQSAMESSRVNGNLKHTTKKAETNDYQIEEAAPSVPQRPFSPIETKEFINDRALSYINTQFEITPYSLKHVNIALTTLCNLNDAKRYLLIDFFFGKKSTKELTEAEALALMFWMDYDPEKYSPAWIPASFSITEYNEIIEEYLGRMSPVEEQSDDQDSAFSGALFGKGGK
jgi:hypothetical protein